MKTSPLARVLAIFAIAFAVIAAFGAIGFGLILLFEQIIFTDGVAGGLIIVIFTAVAWWQALGWQRPELSAVIIALASFMAMLFDARGNPWFNQPLAWICGEPDGAVKVVEHVTHAGGTTSVDYSFQLLNASGQLINTLSGWLVMPLRFVEYLILLSLLLTIIGPLRRRRGGSRWQPMN